MDYNARYYSPLLGKFISADTIIPDPGNVLAWDRYGYAYNNPINYNDPTGHCSYSIGQNVWGIIFSCGKDLFDAGIAYLNGVRDPVILGLEATGGKDLIVDTADAVHQMNDDVDTVFSNEPLLDRIGPSIRVGSFAVETAATVVGLGQIAVSFNKPTNSSLGIVDDLASIQEGDFSVINWDGYPDGPAPRSSGPFNLISKEEYDIARRLANSTNQRLQRNNPQWKGLHIHEIHPVRFGGSPTAESNKIALPPTEHYVYNKFWDKVRRSVTKVK